MIPAATALAKTAAAPKPRLGFFYFPHGAVMEKWTPTTDGTDFELQPILEPLAPFRDQLTIVSNIGNKPGESRAVHALVPATWLSCVHPKESLTPDMATTVDQIAAQTHRPGHAVAVAGDRNGPGSWGRQRLRARLRLQLFGHAVVQHTLDAAAGGKQSAPAVPATVRPGRLRRRAPLPQPADRPACWT